MSVYNVKVRLNLDKPEHRAAYEILKADGKSMSQFVIAAVNAYGGYLSKKEEKELLLRQIGDTVRRTLYDMFGASLSMPANPGRIPTDVAEESGAIADDFLQNF